LAQEGRDSFFRNRKEELIVFPLCECEPGCGAGGEGNLIRVDGKSDARRAGKAGKVSSQSIAKIEHSGGELVANEPLAFGEAWGEGEMVMRPRAAQFSCHKKDVAWFGA
jgi:hypothetical protein